MPTRSLLTTLPGLPCTRSLDVRLVGSDRFAIFDVLGNASLPFRPGNSTQLLDWLQREARIIPLGPLDSIFPPRAETPEQRQSLDLRTLLYQMEAFYVSSIPDKYRIWLCGTGDWHLFDAKKYVLPVAYVECGYGAGSREIFEEIHTRLRPRIIQSDFITDELLLAYIYHIQLERICDDILATVSRAETAFSRLLGLQRHAVRKNVDFLSQTGWNEIKHKGSMSHEIASETTATVVSLATSLDLSAKLINFINETKLPPASFRGAPGRHFSDLKKIRPQALSAQVLGKVFEAWSCTRDMAEMIQFRHDLIHGTSAIELERMFYIGFGTPCVNELPLHYSFLPWRDTEPTGQPVRYLGREYFTSRECDMDAALYKWLIQVIQAHLKVGALLEHFLDDSAKGALHRLSGT